jgi:hypothetical protein
LKQVHYLNLIGVAIGDPVLKFVFHRLIESFRTFSVTTTIAIQKM